MNDRSIFVEDTPETFRAHMRSHLDLRYRTITDAYNEAVTITATAHDNLEHLTGPQRQNLDQAKALYTQATTILDDLHDALTALVTSITGPQPGHHTPYPPKPLALTASLLGKTCYLASPNGEGINGEVVTLDTTYPVRNDDDDDDDWADGDWDNEDEAAQYIILKVPVERTP